MDNLIRAIQKATERKASRPARRAGASACRAILAAIDDRAAFATDSDLGLLARVDLGTLLDVAIARLHVEPHNRRAPKRAAVKE